jgi:hypothetical protein
MTAPSEEARLKLIANAFSMPSVQTMMSRKSSITNAFVNSVIPVIAPSIAEIEEALRILESDPADVRCAYCGNTATEWDHLRPLVVQRRPTGYVTEIANLVPACGKCNQSKGNKPWRTWMLSNARLSPTGRGIAGTSDRIARLEAFEKWRSPTKIDFLSIIGQQEWDAYWALCDQVIDELRRCQEVADSIRNKIVTRISAITEGA